MINALVFNPLSDTLSEVVFEHNVQTDSSENNKIRYRILY